MKLNLISKALVVALSAVSLSACDSDNGDESAQLQPADLQFSFGLDNTKEIANNNNIPMPNDLYFIGEDGIESDNLIVFGCGNRDKVDGRGENEIENNTKCALEDLQGWSTTAPFTLPMVGDIAQLDTTTFANSILILNQDTGDYLTFDKDFTVRTTEFNHLQILPLKPLASNTQYILVITEDLKSRAGDTVERATEFDSLLTPNLGDDKTFAYREQLNELIKTIAEPSISAENILYISGIKTQEIGSVLKNIAVNSELNNHKIESTNKPAPHLVGASLPPNILNLLINDETGTLVCTEDPIDNNPENIKVECVRKLQATIQSPYYLSNTQNIDAFNCAEDQANKDSAKFWFNIDGIDVNNNESYFESYNYTASSCPSLFSNWQFDSGNQNPEIQEVQTLEVQIVLPDETRTPIPENGWPVVIFSHGITAAKEFGNGGMLLLDNFVQAELANQGYAVVAIDHPLHNTRAINLYNEANEGKEVAEINVSQSLRGLFPGHDKADVKNFLKADALLTSRDNLRQSIADLINLRTALSNGITYSGGLTKPDVTESFDMNNVYVMGHSMGAIAAASFTGILEQAQQDAPSVDGLALNGAILANPGAGIAGILMNSVWLGHSEVPPAIKALPEFRLRMAEELGLESDLDVVRQYAEQNPATYKQKSDQLSPEFLSEFQYLIQAVVDTVDPLNYAKYLQDKPMLSFSVTGSISEQPDLKNSQGNYLTTADQTVPIKVELDGQTTYEVCNKSSAMVQDPISSEALSCFNGSSNKPYYSLDNTEFPLSGAEPLETQLGLGNVINSTERSYTRFLTGTHNIGAGTLTGSETEGNSDYASVDSAATELALQAASFVRDNHIVATTNEEIIEK